MTLITLGRFKHSHETVTGKGEENFNKYLNKNNSLWTRSSHTLPSVKGTRPFPFLDQTTKNFIFFILAHLPDLVYSCIDKNNSVLKRRISKEYKKYRSRQEGRRENFVNQI